MFETAENPEDGTTASPKDRHPRERVREQLARLEWPDGPVCPYCGERERVSPEIDGSFVRVRYACVACGRHHGYIRRRHPRSDRPPGALPRDPDPPV